MTVILDDHLLRDWLVGPDDALGEAVGGEALATTNLWYARLCKSAARASKGALVGDLTVEERQALVAVLVELPERFTVVPMRELAWRMGILINEQTGLSTLGAEAVAAARALSGRIIVSSRDDSPGIRAGCDRHSIRYATVRR